MFSWHAIPFARVLIPFILGVFLSIYYRFSVYYLLITLGITLFTYLFFIIYNKYKKIFFTKWQGLIVFLIFFQLGFLRLYFYNNQNSDFSINNSRIKKNLILIEIKEAVIEKDKFYRAYSEVIWRIDSSEKQQKVKGKILTYFKKNTIKTKPKIGDRFIIKSDLIEINEPSNPGEFDYKKYLSYQNIHHQQFIDSNNIIKQVKSNHTLFSRAIEFRDECLLILQKYLNSKNELGVAEALLLGYKDDLDPEIVSAFSRTGTLHVLAVSGLHSALIFMVLSFLTLPLSKTKKGEYFQVLIILLGIWSYAFVTGLSSSVLRASVMFTFINVGKLFKHRTNIYNNIYSSAFFLLLFNPYYIVDVGFQLSYLAVIGIVFIQPMINKLYTPRYWIDQYIWGILSVSIAAQLFTFPISIYYFHQFPNYFMLSNLLIIPLTSLILMGLLVLLALSWFSFIAHFIGKLLIWLIEFNNWLVIKIDQFPYSYINGLHFSFLEMLFFYILILLLASFIIHKKKWQFYFILIISLMISFSFSYYSTIHNNQIKVTVHKIKGHDVFTCIEGKKVYLISDSIFLKNKSSIKFYLEPFFWENGVKEIQKVNSQKNYQSKNLLVVANRGIQFFDKKMTINEININDQKNEHFIYLTIDELVKKNIQFVTIKKSIIIINSNHYRIRKLLKQNQILLKENEFILTKAFELK